MLVKTVGYTLFTCQWLQSRPKRVCIWTPVFHRIQRGRLHLAGKRRHRGSIGAFMRLCSVSVVTSLQNSSNLSSALMLFNVLMVMTASDRPSAAESDFLCRHTHTHTLKLTVCRSRLQPNTKPKKNSNWCMCVLHEFEPPFR